MYDISKIEADEAVYGYITEYKHSVDMPGYGIELKIYIPIHDAGGQNWCRDRWENNRKIALGDDLRSNENGAQA